MRALITAQFDPASLEHLSRQLSVRQVGWGVTGIPLSPAELIRELEDTDILVTEIEDCTAEVIEACPKLAFIAVCRNNPVNVDAKAARKRGIPVVYTPGRNAEAVAEFTLCLMLMLARNLGRALRDISSSQWTLGPVESYLHYKGCELSGRRVGIIGLGSIGRRVLALCEAFGMRACVHDPFLAQRPAQAPGVSFADLPILLRWADFVTLHCPDTPETTGLIGRNELALMNSNAYLINTARGKHVDEAALLEALRERRIAGAAADVFQREPLPPDHPFYQLDNMLITPHIAGSTVDVVAHQSEIVYAEIQRWRNDEPLRHAWESDSS